MYFCKINNVGFIRKSLQNLFSDTDHTYPEEHDVIFYDSEIFYKSNGIDSLYIYKPSNIRKPEENRLLGKVKVKTITVVMVHNGIITNGILKILDYPESVYMTG